MVESDRHLAPDRRGYGERRARPVTGVEVEIATVRRWQRRDWGDDGTTMAWCCTEGDRAYVGDRPVIQSLSDELTAIVGDEVMVELRRRAAR